MLTLNANPVLLGRYAERLQAHINIFAEAAKTAPNGYVRFDSTIEDAQKNVVGKNLLTAFRTLATKLDSDMEFKPTQQVVQFVLKALPQLVTPEITFTPYPERPARTMVTEHGEEITLKPMKAQTVVSFGKPKSKLSPEAQAANAAAMAEWDAIEAAVKTAPATVASPDDINI